MQEYIQYHKDRDPKETYSARVVKDSINNGVRLTTLECTFPRIVLAEFNTHRVFSRNSASSRAIPTNTRIKSIKRAPFVPESFGKNKPGMSASEDVENQDEARKKWLESCEKATEFAQWFDEQKIHKQLANRILEPYAWHTVICTATEWQNFFNLRIEENAQPEIRIISELMLQALKESVPQELFSNQWHLPFIFEEDNEFDEEQQIRLSIARCARVSYLTHDGRRDPSKDFGLYDMLVGNGHMSPTEHAAVVGEMGYYNSNRDFLSPEYSCGYNGTKYGTHFVGNFRAPWIQYRKLIPGEAVFKK